MEVLNKQRALSDDEIHQYLIEEDLAKNRSEYGKGKIKDCHIIPLIEARLVEEKEKNRFRITSLGKKITVIVSESKELEALPPPMHQTMYSEHIFLELKKGRKTYNELKTLVKPATLRKLIPRWKNRGFLKVKHPRNSLHVTYLSRFSISSYYLFLQGIRDYLKMSSKSWFTEYSLAHYLTRRWQAKFGKPLDVEEARELIQRGIEAGDIIRTNGAYTFSIQELRSSEKKILRLIEKEDVHCSSLAEKSGFHWSTVYKILRRLEKRNLVDKEIEHVTVELTEKGQKLADCLFEIKKCIADYFRRHGRPKKELRQNENRRNLANSH